MTALGDLTNEVQVCIKPDACTETMNGPLPMLSSPAQYDQSDNPDPKAVEGHVTQSANQSKTFL